MGVYIPGMDMPTSCNGCPFNFVGHCVAHNGLYVERKSLEYNSKPNWCPLVPVPEHGDLIDRRNLKNREITIDFDEWDDTFEDGLLFVADLIDNAPTIIPAEEG